MEESCLRKRTISPSFKSLSFLNHLGCEMSFGTCEISQFSNQVLKMLIFVWMILSKVDGMLTGPMGHLSLLRPRRSLFGVIRSILSKLDVVEPSASGILLRLLDISEAMVSHWRTDSLDCEIVLSMDLEISWIFRSTLP